MSRDEPEIVIARELDVGYGGGGFFTVECRREKMGGNRAPYFSFTYTEYPSRRAWEMRNDNAQISGGANDEMIAKIAPEVVPYLPMHLAWTDNGEPMQGVSNGWYRLSGDDVRHEIEYRERRGHPNYSALRDVDPASAEFTLFFLGMACASLRCELHELSAIDLSKPEVEAKAMFQEFVQYVLRPRWRREAEEANAWFDSFKGDERPPEIHDEPEFELTFENGLKIEAKLDEHYEGEIGDRRHWYDVTISYPGVEPHKARYGGSNADYDEGRVSARDAAFGTAKSLRDFENYTARGWIEELCGESWDEVDPETQRALEAAEAAWDRLGTFIEPNMEVIG